MLRSAVAIVGIIGVLLRHYLTSSKSQTPKPQSQDENQNEAVCTEQEAMTSNSDGIDVPFCCEGMCVLEAKAKIYTSNVFDALELRKPVLEDVMKALADPNTHLIGVHGFHDDIKDTLLEIIYRRVQRDQLFGMVVTATVTKCPDVKKIQEDIASQLGLAFNHMSKDERAKKLNHRMKNEQNILIVLRDLYKELDLSKVGIPYGIDHMGCKILLTSTTEHVLSDHMRPDKFHGLMILLMHEMTEESENSLLTFINSTVCRKSFKLLLRYVVKGAY